MSPDVMSRLAAADPLQTAPAAEPPERLRRLVEQEPAPEPGAARQRRSVSSGRRTLLAGSLLALMACLAALLFLGGSGGTGVNVAAAAYSATSPGSGIVEAVFVAHSFDSPEPAVLRQQEWLDGASAQRRELNTLDEAGHPPVHQVTDWAFSPHLTEEWTPGSATLGSEVARKDVPPGQRAQVVVRLQHENQTLSQHIAFAGIGMSGVEGIALYRDLYRKGWMRIAGHASKGGRLLWRLESRGGVSRPGSSRTVHTKLVVLVDPVSFLPVRETLLEIAGPGRPRVLVASDLVRYRRIPATPAALKLFDLAVQHPSARVVIRQARLPKFVPMHPGSAGGN
jgi:hypothetical protein